VPGIQPNQAGGPGTSTPGGGTTAPAGPQPFDGVPEHVPNLTFIVRARVTPDGFIDPANTYHRNCGLAPSAISSFENLLSQLAASSGHIGRMRIVSHAHPNAILVAMFEGLNVFQINEEWLNGFAQSDVAGLRSILDVTHVFSWRTGPIRAHIQANNAALLTPFGTNPPAALDEVLRFAADIALVNLGLVTRGGAALNNARRAILRRALTFQAIAAAGPLLTAGATQPQVNALVNFVSGMTLQELGPTSASYDFGTGTLDQFAIADAALNALGRTFRADLNAARARFDSRSFIDIRGCRAGDTESYLQAVQRFFGRTENLPTVSAPRWFQFFGRCPAERPQNNAAIRTFLTTGPDAAVNRDGFDDWISRTRVDPLHKDFWRDLLSGNAVAFCRLTWRANIPPLHAQFRTPGLSNFNTLSFRDTLTRIVDLFRVTSSVPAGAALNTLETFVNGQLATWAPHLLAVANTTTPAPQLQTLYTQLKTINDALGQSIVPATPSPLRATDISGYQTALVAFLDANQLAPARQFMNAVKARIDDAADPGLRYYILQIGLPVFIFAKREEERAGHIINVQRNRLVVLRGPNEDEAYRQWPPLLWVEALPPGNRFGTIRVTDADACHLQMMVESDQVGQTPVETCPHPDYMDKVRVVRPPTP
jgi:hypothetical protein